MMYKNHPESNGLIENRNKEIWKRIKKFLY